jgi:hypothetical protein
MIKCICINDSKKPKEIPKKKWIKKGNEYHVIYTVWSIPSQKLGVHLHEISLDEESHPYEYFSIDRFIFNIDSMEDLQKLIKDCSDTDISIDELMKQTQVSNYGKSKAII